MSIRCERARSRLAVEALRVVATAAAIIGVASEGRAQSITNGKVTLAFDPSPVGGNGLALASIGDAAESAAFQLANGVDLWTVELRDPTNGQVVKVGTAAAGGAYSFSQTASSLAATWIGCTAPSLGGETFDVYVTAEAPAFAPLDGGIEFRIRVDTSTPTRSLFGIVFPRIRWRERGDPTTTTLTIPIVQGTTLADPASNPFFLSLAAASSVFDVGLLHPGALGMQWFSYWNSAEASPALLFLGSRDPSGYRKEWLSGVDGSTTPKRMELALRHWPENHVVADVDYDSNATFPVFAGVLRGDWYDAASEYRRWALEQPWTAGGPKRTNPAYSARIRDAEMFAFMGPDACNPTPGLCGSIPDLSQFAFWGAENARQRALFGVQSIPQHANHWDWNGSIAREEGEWFPVVPEFLAAAPAVDDPIAPYLSVSEYCTTAPSYAAPYVIDSTTGQPYASVAPYAKRTITGSSVFFPSAPQCPKNQGCVVLQPIEYELEELCTATAFASDYVVHVADVVGSPTTGVSGLYLDSFSNQDFSACYDASHTHGIVGGGKWWTEARLELCRRVVDHLGNAKGIAEPFLYSEVLNEVYLGDIELFYQHLTTATSTIGSFAPMFDTVYHDFTTVGTTAAVNFPVGGAWSDPQTLAMHRQNYAARVFTGAAPFAGAEVGASTLLDFYGTETFPEYDKWIEMIVRYMQVLRRPDVRDFVTFGRRLRDPQVVRKTVFFDPAEWVPWQFLWLPYSMTQPFVYVGALGRADRKGVALLVLNWSHPGDAAFFPGIGQSGDETIEILVDPVDYGIPPGRYDVHEITSAGKKTLGWRRIGTAPFTLVHSTQERSASVLLLEPFGMTAEPDGKKER